MDYLHDSALELYRRRRRQRTVFTMTCVSLLLGATVVYAVSNVQGWVSAAPKTVANVSCTGATSLQVVTPRNVTINVYNSTARIGLAATAANSLEEQGFRVATIDNDPLGKTLLNVGEIRYGQSGLEGARLASKALPGSSLVLDDRLDASVDMVVGKQFRAVRILPKKVALTAPRC